MRTSVRTIFMLNVLICFMQQLYYEINQQLKEWIACATSNRDFALNHNIDEKTVRRILEGRYRISLGTLQKICEARNIKLSEFFKLVETGKKNP